VSQDCCWQGSRQVVCKTHREGICAPKRTSIAKTVKVTGKKNKSIARKSSRKFVMNTDSPVSVTEEKGSKKCKLYSNAGLSCCRSRATTAKQRIPEGKKESLCAIASGYRRTCGTMNGNTLSWMNYRKRKSLLASTQPWWQVAILAAAGLEYYHSNQR
jgi:hypothetical protein